MDLKSKVKCGCGGEAVKLPCRDWCPKEEAKKDAKMALNSQDHTLIAKEGNLFFVDDNGDIVGDDEFEFIDSCDISEGTISGTIYNFIAPVMVRHEFNDSTTMETYGEEFRKSGSRAFLTDFEGNYMLVEDGESVKYVHPVVLYVEAENMYYVLCLKGKFRRLSKYIIE